MTDFKKKKNPYRTFLLNLGAVFVVAMVVLLLVADVKVHNKKKELDAKVASLESKINDLKEKNGQLKEGAARVNEDAYIEKIAREELDLQKPGEKVFSFVEADGQTHQPVEQKTGFAAWITSFLNIFKK